jgi:probable ribonuclease FAU-1
MQGRFNLPRSFAPPSLFINDRPDLQGIYITGNIDQVSSLATLFQQALLDAVLLHLRATDEAFFPPDESFEPVRAVFDFGGAAKSILDQVRSSVLPTLPGHHRFSIIDPEALEEAEATLKTWGISIQALQDRLFQDTILVPLKRSGRIIVEHVKIEGRPVRPLVGDLSYLRGKKAIMRRSFREGWYDGIDLPIEEGDYGITEFEEGAWSLRHSYYAQSGILKGEYHNVNTPIELYPWGARYVDLEIDVVRSAGSKAHIIDREPLDNLEEKKLISPRLKEKAMQVARDLLSGLKGGTSLT